MLQAVLGDDDRPDDARDATSPSPASVSTDTTACWDAPQETSYGTDDERWDVLERVGIVNAGCVSANAACGW